MAFSALPDDLALQVFEQMSQEDKLHLSLVCKPWRKLLAKPTTVWHTLLVHPPAKRTPEALASLLEFLKSRKASVRELYFSRNTEFMSQFFQEVATMYNYLDMCPHLEKVTIYQCGSHACGTETLHWLPKLQFLEIHVQPEANDKLEEVYTFCFPEHIRTLVLQAHFMDVDLHSLFESLTVLSSLACLHLCICCKDNEMSLAWRHLRSLESLHLQGFNYAPEWGSDFSCLTRLTLLSFAELIDPVPLHELAALPALQTLHMRADCESVEYYLDLETLPELPPTLRELRAVEVMWDPQLSSLRGLANLRVCMLHCTGGSVSLPAHMPHVHTLVLDGNPGLVLEDHLTGFTALRLLSLRECGQVAVPGAFNQLAALPHLTCIDVADSLPENQLDWSSYGGLPGSLPKDNLSQGQFFPRTVFPKDMRPHLVYEGMIKYEY